MQKFYSKHQHLNVGSSHKMSDGRSLSTWMEHVRNKYKNGALSWALEERLERTDGWAWDPRQEAFNEGYDILCRYSEQNGHCVVPFSFKIDDGFRLDQWVGRRRSEYQNGTLPDERSKALEKLSGWTWDPKMSAFNSALAHLHDYLKSKKSSSNPAQYKTKDGFGLGGWARRIRKQYENGALQEEQIAMLEELSEWHWK